MDVQEYIDAKLVHSVHTSERRSFRGCRRRWSWIFRDTYYPRVTAKPLEFGVAYHKAMEIYFEPTRWNVGTEEARQALAKKAFFDVCKTQYNAYVENFGSPSSEVVEDYDDRVQLGNGMLNYFFDTIAPEFRERFVPMGVEVKFEVPITDPDGNQLWCKCRMCFERWMKHFKPEQDPNTVPYDPKTTGWYGLPVTYGGRLDILVYDLRLGGYYILDWKTAARLSANMDTFLISGELPAHLINDDQITSYVWALRLVLNLDIKGFIYWEQFKGYPQEPEPMKQRRKGLLYSVNKQQDVSYETYRRTVEDNDVEAYNAGLYDEFLEYLREGGKRYHGIYPVNRNDAELASAGYHIWLEAADMVDPGLRVYPSAGRFSCSTCAFAEPCRMMNAGEDYKYMLETSFDKRGYHYWEDAPKTTEQRGRVS